jgi:hypothetical protein
MRKMAGELGSVLKKVEPKRWPFRRSEKAAVFGTSWAFFGSSLERKPEDPKKRHQPTGHPVGFRIIARP